VWGGDPGPRALLFVVAGVEPGQRQFPGLLAVVIGASAYGAAPQMFD